MLPNETEIRRKLTAKEDNIVERKRSAQYGVWTVSASPITNSGDGLVWKVAALARPRLHRCKLQSETAAELDTLLPSIFDKAFKGEL